jgi:3-oxoadipate enol-lactonase
MIVRTRSGTVGYETRGEGEPLLLLHGFPHDRTLWTPQLANDGLGVRRIAPDLPGFGESTAAAEASLECWADWVADLLDALALRRVILGGLSMGGYLAFAVWRRHPGRVRGLVLADTRAGADSEEGRAKRREMQALARAEGAAAVAERMSTGMVGRTTRDERPAVVATLDAMMRRAPVPAITDALQALMDREDSTSTLETITVPTLVVCGEEDVLTPPAESRALHAAIAGSELAIIPRAGHASNLEDPAGFDGLLSRFLAATIRRTSP